MKNNDYLGNVLDSIDKVEEGLGLGYATRIGDKAKAKTESLKASLAALRVTALKLRDIHNLWVAGIEKPLLTKENAGNNKKAMEAKKILSSISKEVNEMYPKLVEEFTKQMKQVQHQCFSVTAHIEDRWEKSRFEDDVESIRAISTNSEETPFMKFSEYNEDDMSKEKNEQLNGHMEIDRRYENEETNELEESLAVLNTLLANAPRDNLSKEITKEVSQIRKVLPPKTIAISNEYLEQLRNSEKLSYDLDRIKDIMGAANPDYIRLKDKKWQKLREELKDLQVVLEEAIKEEEERKTEIQADKESLDDKVAYAAEVTDAYGNMLEANAKLSMEQEELDKGTHELNGMSADYRKDEMKTYANIDKTVDRMYDTGENYMEATKGMAERARIDRMMQADINREIMDKKIQQPIEELPEEYKNMKNKLKNVSSLNNVYTGGITR